MNLCIKPIPNKAEFRFMEKFLEKVLFCFFQKVPLCIEWPLYLVKFHIVNIFLILINNNDYDVI